MDTDTELGILKQCSRCQHFKINTEFHKSPTSRDGLQSRCKQCQNELNKLWSKNNPAKRRAAHKEWRQNNREHSNRQQRDWHKAHPGKASDYDLKKHYGLPYGTYAKMLAEQGGRCAICRTGKPGGNGKRFHVDHCHETKAVRGLLCAACNLGLGKLKHDPAILGSAIQYLTQTRK